eukprot:m.3698 g.3698  ORF g.3698 m.3698 type:complete len:250 (-) comp2112_c0_seq1:69-818(-)
MDYEPTEQSEPLQRRVENVLKKRKRKDQVAIVKARKAADARKRKRKTNHGWFKRAEQFVKERRRMAADNTRIKHLTRNKHKSPVADDAQLLLVARVKGVNGSSGKIIKMLKVLKLSSVNRAVFVQKTDSILRILQLLDPYVIYGVPSLKTTRDLVYKHGYGSIDGKKVPLNDNAKIEKLLGKHNIICVEDLVNEILSTGPAFNKVSSFLLPFELQPPMGGWKKKGIHFLDDGEVGFVGDKINTFIEKVC